MNSLEKKPIILFFSRDYQSELYPALVSEKYNSIYVTLNIREKKNVERLGGLVVGCLEEEFENLPEAEISFPYLEYSIGSDRFIRGHSHKKRLSILKKCVFFWQNILDKYQPNFVMNEVVALEIAEIMLLEARKRNILYLASGAMSFENSFYWHFNQFHSAMGIELEAVQSNEHHRLVAKEFISKVGKGVAENPHIKGLRKSKDIKHLFSKTKALFNQIIMPLKIGNKAIRQICYYQSPGYYFKELSFYLNYNLRGRSYDDINNFNREVEVVFYPLHFEPEATMFYMSPYYEDQFALVENILKCMKEDQVLVIKEHPAQAGFLMQKQFRDLKKRFPNVLFLKAEVPSLKVIDRANIIVTLVSTAGFEALVLGKPVIVLGNVYYNTYEGVNYCKTFEEVYSLLRGHTTFNKPGDIEGFISKLVALLHPGYPWPHSTLYLKENLSNIRVAIESRISY